MSLNEQDEDISRLGAHIGEAEAGGIYVGKSATTGRDLYTTPHDEPVFLDFRGAFEAAARMQKIPGRETAHVPTMEELDVNLYRNRDKGLLRGTFVTADEIPGAFYRSSTEDLLPEGPANWVRYFHLGNDDLANGEKQNEMSVRLVWEAPATKKKSKSFDL